MIEVLKWVAVSAVSLTVGVLLARIHYREWHAQMRAAARADSIQRAKQRGSARAAAAAVRVQTLGVEEPVWGWPGVPVADGIRYVDPHADGQPYVDEEPRPVAEILAELPGPPPIPPSKPARLPGVESARSPLYQQTLAELPTLTADAEAFTAAVREPAGLDWGDLLDVEPTPDEDVPQDEARVTSHGRARQDDDDPPAGPPPGQLDREVPAVVEVPAPAVTAVPRYPWPRHAGPVGPWRPSDKLRTWATALRQAGVRLTHRPRVKIRHLTPMWTGGELARVMTGVPSSARAIVRHRRRGGTWAVAA